MKILTTTRIKTLLSLILCLPAIFNFEGFFPIVAVVTENLLSILRDILLIKTHLSLIEAPRHAISSFPSEFVFQKIAITFS